MKLPEPLRTLKLAALNIFEDDIFTLAASVAFFTTLSIAPLLVLLLSITGMFSESFHEELVTQLQLLSGPAAARAIDVVLDNIEEQVLIGKISAIISGVILLFSSTAVFVQLQKAMNRIWGVRTKPSRAVKNWFRKRLVSLAMILVIGLLLIASIMLNTAINFIFEGTGDLLGFANTAGTILIYIILFGSMLLNIPNVKLHWGDIAMGAVTTALFFHFGKWAIGRYLSYSGIGSAYGAAGTLVVALLWVYYSTLVVFLGTELAKAYAQRRGTIIRPDEDAT